MKTIPPLLSEYSDLLRQLKSVSAIRKALQQAKDEMRLAMEEQIRLCEVEAPTFEEKERGELLASLFRQYGLTDISVDRVGNVIGRRPGRNPDAPVLAMGAHMDSVFRRGTDVKVRREGRIFRAPGIGDNCSGLRALLQVLRMFQTQQIETEGDLLFVGTVGEEGNGDIRGSKHLVKSDLRIDGFLAIDSTNVGRVLHGATGSRRWKIRVQGKGGHSYAEFGLCPSAIHAICRAGAKVANIVVPTRPKTTYTIGKIEGGTTVNTIAAYANVQVDMRSVDPKCLKELEEKVLKAFREAVQEENAFWNIQDPELMLKLNTTLIGDRPAGMRPDDCPVLQSARSAQKVLGIRLTHYQCASTDANAPMSVGMPSTCICSGGRGMKAHTVEEYFEWTRDTYLGPQLIFMTACALIGVAGNKPTLPLFHK